MRALRIAPEASEVVEIDNTLPALQDAVGCNIDVVSVYPHEVIMIVDDEGLLKGYSFNPGASIIAQRTIVGTVLLLSVNEEEFTDLSEIFCDFFSQLTEDVIRDYQRLCKEAES